MPEVKPKLGLRFSKHDALLLRARANAVRNDELHGHGVSVFEMAADAAEKGEPLMVEYEDPAEVVAMAQAYIQHGCSPPAIEVFSGE